MSTETHDIPAESPDDPPAEHPDDIPTERLDDLSRPSNDPSEQRPETASSEEWYTSMAGLGVVGFDVALMLVIAAATTRFGDNLVPWEVYMFGALGALGYVFRSILHGFDQSVTEILEVNVQVLAAIPLSAGIYLVSDFVHPSEPPLEFVAGTSFVVGLYVDLAYDRLSQVADSVLSRGFGDSQSDGKTGSSSSTGERET